MAFYTFNNYKKTCLKNKGFTLMELVVTMAVSSIFFVILGTVLTSVYRCYHQSMELSNEQIEFNTTVRLIDKAMEEVNKEGKNIVIDSTSSLNTDSSIRTLILKDSTNSTVLKIEQFASGLYAITYKISQSAYNTEYINSISYSRPEGSSDLIEFQLQAIKKEKIQLQTNFSYRILGGIA